MRAASRCVTASAARSACSSRRPPAGSARASRACAQARPSRRRSAAPTAAGSPATSRRAAAAAAIMAARTRPATTTAATAPTASPYARARGGARRAKMGAMPSLLVRAAAPADAPAIAAIYNEGIADRIATFETRERTTDEVLGWLDDDLPLIVAVVGDTIVGFARVSSYSDRCVYDGV